MERRRYVDFSWNYENVNSRVRYLVFKWRGLVDEEESAKSNVFVSHEPCA